MSNELFPKGTVHKILAHSYALSLGLFLAGVVLDIIFSLKIFPGRRISGVGLFFLLIGTGLVLWAQQSTRDFQKENISQASFSRGPYAYSRNPTHWGIFFLMLGFGLLGNAFFVVIFSFLSFLLTKIFFLKKEENVLARKYGPSYIEYKKSVKL